MGTPGLVPYTGHMTATVIYERDEAGWWVADIARVPGCHTQGGTIEQARERIRDALGLYADDSDTAQFQDVMRDAEQAPNSRQRV